MLQVDQFFQVPISATAPASPSVGDMWRDTNVQELKVMETGGWKVVPEVLGEDQHVAAIYRDGQTLFQYKFNVATPGIVLRAGVGSGVHSGATPHTVIASFTHDLISGDVYEFSAFTANPNHAGGVIRFDAFEPGKTATTTATPANTALTGDHHAAITIPAVSTAGRQIGTAFTFTAAKTGTYTFSVIVDGLFDNFAYSLISNAHDDATFRILVDRTLTGLRTDLGTVTETKTVYGPVITGYFMKHPILNNKWHPVTTTTVSTDNGLPFDKPIKKNVWAAVMNIVGVTGTCKGRSRVEAAVTINSKIAGNAGILIQAYPKGTKPDITDPTIGAISETAQSPANGAIGGTPVAAGMNNLESWIEFNYDGDVDIHVYIRDDEGAAQEVHPTAPGWCLDWTSDPIGSTRPLDPFADVDRPVIELEGSGHSGSAHVFYSDITKEIGAMIDVETFFNASPSRKYRMPNPIDQVFEAPLGERIDRVVVNGLSVPIAPTTPPP